MSRPRSAVGGEDLQKFSQIFPPITQWHLPHLYKLELSFLEIPFHDLIGLLFINLPQLKHLHLSFIYLPGGDWADVAEGLRRLKTLSSCRFEYALYYVAEDGSVYICYQDTGEHAIDFLLAHSIYVEGGSRHPYLLDHEPKEAFTKYTTNVNRALDFLLGQHENFEM